MNELNATHFKEVKNTLQRMVSFKVYILIFMTYTSMCSSRLVVPWYLSRVGLFQFGGSAISMIPSVKEC